MDVTAARFGHPAAAPGLRDVAARQRAAVAAGGAAAPGQRKAALAARRKLLDAAPIPGPSSRACTDQGRSRRRARQRAAWPRGGRASPRKLLGQARTLAHELQPPTSGTNNCSESREPHRSEALIRRGARCECPKLYDNYLNRCCTYSSRWRACPGLKVIICVKLQPRMVTWRIALRTAT